MKNLQGQMWSSTKLKKNKEPNQKFWDKEYGTKCKSSTNSLTTTLKSRTDELDNKTKYLTGRIKEQKSLRFL